MFAATPWNLTNFINDITSLPPIRNSELYKVYEWLV